jgi:hypothetical protein
MSPSWWHVLDVSGWALEGEEKRGRREKVWILDPTGTRWLRKRPRASRRPGEIAIEAFAPSMHIPRQHRVRAWVVKDDRGAVHLALYHYWNRNQPAGQTDLFAPLSRSPDPADAASRLPADTTYDGSWPHKLRQ